MAKHRCARCHAKGLPRDEYVRITNPANDRFLLAPLAKNAGGTGKCGEAVFASRSDPDYTAILAAFDPVDEQLRSTPRKDME